MLPINAHGCCREKIVPLLILLLVAFGVFANTFGNTWTYDDLVVLVNNPDIRSLDDFLRNSYPGRPLREITYLLDHALFGLDPAGYHVQNIFWHGFNAYLVFLLVTNLGGKRLVAWVSSLLFLLHPIQVEVVANISHRKDSLVLAFALLAFLAYIRAVQEEGGRWRWVAASVVFWLIALSAKQNALALVLLVPVYELAKVPPENRLVLKRGWLLPFFAVVSFVVGAVWFSESAALKSRFWAIQGMMAKANFFSTATEDIYFTMVLKSWAFMFKRLVLPFDLALEYSFPVPGSWLDWWVVSSIVGIVFYFVVLIRSFGRNSLLFVALSWAGVFWLPVSNIIPLSYFAADRYLYISSVGFCIVLAIAFERVFRYRPKAAMGVVALVLLSYSGLVWQQNKVWRDDLSLWSQAVQVSPTSTYALGYLGMTYLERGEPVIALPLLRKAAANPSNIGAKNALGIAMRQLERLRRGKASPRYLVPER